MEKEFVPYELAVKLKALGFDNIPCFAVYYDVPELEDWEYDFFDFHNHFSYRHYETQYYAQKGYKNGVLAPTFSQAFRWFRENYPDLDFGIAKIHNGTNNYHYHINLTWEFFEGTYEEAELACLDKLIKIVEQEK